MGPPTWRTLEPTAVTQLAKILQIPHGEAGDAYYRRVRAALPKLPRALKHRAEILSLLDVFTGKTKFDDYIEPAKLCAVHTGLSQGIIHQAFTLLSLEIGHMLNSLVGHSELLTEIQRSSIYNLRELHSLWLAPRDYLKTFGISHNPRWPFQKSKCEACVLAHIGSDEQAVCELKVVLMSRRRTYHPRPGRPRLLGLVDGWLENLFSSRHVRNEMIQGLSMQGEELKIIRKSIRRKRKEQREQTRDARQNQRHTLAASPRHGEASRVKAPPRISVASAPLEELDPPPMDEDDGADSDFEHEIIDHYAKLQSSMPAGSPMPPCGGSPVSSLAPSDAYVPPRQEPAWMNHSAPYATDLTMRKAPRALSTQSSWYSVTCENSSGCGGSPFGDSSLRPDPLEYISWKQQQGRQQQIAPPRPVRQYGRPALERTSPPRHDFRHDRTGKGKVKEQTSVLRPLPQSANRADYRDKLDRNNPFNGAPSDVGRQAAQIVKEKYGGGRSNVAVRREDSRQSMASHVTNWDEFCN